MPSFEVLDIVLCDDAPRGMHETVNIHRGDGTQTNLGVNVADVVRFRIVVPGNDLHDVRYHLLNGLLPAVVPKCVTQFDPVLTSTELLELPRRDSCGSRYIVSFI